MFKSLKYKLFLWYVGSLLFVITYFLLFIHYYTVPHAIHILIILFIILAIVQFTALLKTTKSITFLSAKIKSISSENLEERVEGLNSQDEIGELAHSFNSLLARLNEAFKREQQFIADVAHELKTPLSTLISSCEVILSKPREKTEYKQTIKDVLTEAQQLSTTLKDVLDLAWSEAPKNSNEKRQFNLSNLLDDIYEIAQRMAKIKHIEVGLSNTPDVFITGFKDKLARALLNLVDNAIKYSLPNGKIELILEKTPTKILISVIDKGRGIPEKDLPHIFDRFYQGSQTNVMPGSGLGLAITKAISSLHQGEIMVKSQQGKGSTFVVVLPVSQNLSS